MMCLILVMVATPAPSLPMPLLKQVCGIRWGSSLPRPRARCWFLWFWSRPVVIIETESDATASWTRESGRLREPMLDAMVTVTLTETDTVMLLEVPSVRVLQDTAEFRVVSWFVVILLRPPCRCGSVPSPPRCRSPHQINATTPCGPQSPSLALSSTLRDLVKHCSLLLSTRRFVVEMMWL
jgi:hypothetical protein